MTNQIMTIAPYWDEDTGTWVYDDPRFEVVAEPFVAGVPDMINWLVQDIPNARAGFRLTFSKDPFPGYQKRLDWVRKEDTGNWYFLRRSTAGRLAVREVV